LAESATHLACGQRGASYWCNSLISTHSKSAYLALRAGFEARRIRLYRHAEFVREASELLELERKIDHPISGSKDTADAVAGAYASAILSDETTMLCVSNQEPVIATSRRTKPKRSRLGTIKPV
jgi:hypothetical protein